MSYLFTESSKNATCCVSSRSDIRIRFTIVDEADELLHSDWENEFTKIMSGGGMINFGNPFSSQAD